MSTLLSEGTLLEIIPLSGTSAFELTPYSARNITQSLEPIAGLGGGGDAMGKFIRRSLTGTLVNLQPPWFHKYASVVTCTDFNTPCLDDAWFGTEVLVHCAAELSYPSGGTAQRPSVSGSERENGSFIFYRPVLTMMVTQITNSLREWSAEYSWVIGLQEK